MTSSGDRGKTALQNRILGATWRNGAFFCDRGSRLIHSGNLLGVRPQDAKRKSTSAAAIDPHQDRRRCFIKFRGGFDGCCRCCGIRVIFAELCQHLILGWLIERRGTNWPGNFPEKLYRNGSPSSKNTYVTNESRQDFKMASVVWWQIKRIRQNNNEILCWLVPN